MKPKLVKVDDFELEACELRVIEKTLKEVRVLSAALHENMVDTLLQSLMVAVELRCMEVLKRKQGTHGHDGSP